MRLLIPGPVTTSAAVKAAAAHDYAPWDNDFRDVVAGVRERVRRIANGSPAEHTALIIQGCGHFAVEACCRTLLPPGGRLLLPQTGQYADRFGRLATEAGRVVVPLAVAEGQRVDPAQLDRALAADASLDYVALIYSETATGLVHDVPALAEIAGRHGRRVIVDGVSAFGALPLDLRALPMIDAVVFTTNKCLEGLPGASFVVARQDRLAQSAGNARSWSLDLSDLHQHYTKAPGSHRFTPAAGTIAAFAVAIDLFDAEGGQPARLARYTANAQTLYAGVRRLGLHPSIPQALQGPIVTNVDAPADPNWDLQRFVDGLKSRGFIISNFYNTTQPSFRVGCIGAITPDDINEAVAAMEATLDELNVRDRAPRRAAAAA